MWKRCTVLLLLTLPPSVSKETPTPRMCEVCLDKDCATGVRRIYPAGGDTAVWSKAKSPTGIQNCSMENLKADVPCKMANGSLVQLADNPLQFEGIDTYDVRHVFNSHISSCADLNLPFKPSLVTKAPIHDTSNPAAPNDSVADNKGIIIGSVIGIIIFISIGVLIWMLLNCGNGDRTVSPNGNAAQIQPLNAEVPNGNVNGVHCEDDSIGTAGPQPIRVPVRDLLTLLRAKGKRALSNVGEHNPMIWDYLDIATILPCDLLVVGNDTASTLFLLQFFSIAYTL